MSTEEQALDSNALKNQIQRLKHSGASRVYWDVESRTSDDRQGLEALLRDIQYAKPKVDVVLITRIDRLTASPVVLQKFVSTLRMCGTRLEGLDERIDLDSVEGEFAVDLQVVLAKREVRMTALRVRKINELRRKQGKPNYLAPFGYVIENEQYKLDHTPLLCLIDTKQEYTKAEVARLMIEMFFQVRSLSALVREIHKRFGIQKFRVPVTSQEESFFIESEDFEIRSRKSKGRIYGRFEWSIEGLRTWIINPVLAGGTPYDTRDRSKGHRLPRSQWKVNWNTHQEVICSFSEHQQILEILQLNKSNNWGCYTRSKRKYPFSGLIFCGKCGSKYRICGATKKQGKRLIYYQCRNYNEDACDQIFMIPANLIEQIVMDELAMKAEAIADLADFNDEYRDEEIIKLENKLGYLRLIPEKDSGIEDLIAQYEAQIRRIRSEKQQRQSFVSQSRKILIEYFSVPDWDISDADKYRLYRLLVKRIVVRDRQVVSVELRL
ncbi:hypothetical protein BV378_15260 [Nostoc sp. RF31YmG]|nr:hypothetical protein BV378_15260 [Nostoc sp. RF31YmG]